MEKVKVEIFLLYKIHRINLKTFKVFSLPYWSKSFKALFIQGVEFSKNIEKLDTYFIHKSYIFWKKKNTKHNKIFKAMLLIYYNKYY